MSKAINKPRFVLTDENGIKYRWYPKYVEDVDLIIDWMCRFFGDPLVKNGYWEKTEPKSIENKKKIPEWFIEATGLDYGFTLLNQAYQDYLTSPLEFHDWWAVSQRDYA
jgi:hypothetical protein